MADELYDLRNSMVLGNYAQVISEGSSLKPNPYKKQPENEAMLAERDMLVHKAYIGMGQYDIVIDDLANATSPQSKAIRLLAQYMKFDAQGNDTGKTNAVNNAKDLAKTAESLPAAQQVPVVLTVASILIHDEDLELALKMLRNAQSAAANTPNPQQLELHGLVVDILLRIHRPDLAEKEHEAMSKIDDDATLTQLNGAWVCLSQGGDKVGEALQIFEELKEKFGTGVLLLNGMALANMAQGKYETAEKLLLDAMSKRSSDPETLINLVTCSQHLKKGMNLVSRYITQLKTTYPQHPWVRGYLAMESKFDKACRQ